MTWVVGNLQTMLLAANHFDLSQSVKDPRILEVASLNPNIVPWTFIAYDPVTESTFSCNTPTFVLNLVESCLTFQDQSTTSFECVTAKEYCDFRGPSFAGLTNKELSECQREAEKLENPSLEKSEESYNPKASIPCIIIDTLVDGPLT
jgi:hypothetical protein